jgi:hypothetical protein
MDLSHACRFLSYFAGLVHDVRIGRIFGSGR